MLTANAQTRASASGGVTQNLTVLRLSVPGQQLRIEIRRVILVEHLRLRHTTFIVSPLKRPSTMARYLSVSMYVVNEQGRWLIMPKQSPIVSSFPKSPCVHPLRPGCFVFVFSGICVLKQAEPTPASAQQSCAFIWMRSSKLEKVLETRVEDVLEPLFAFLASDRPFEEVSRVAVVSRNWRTVALKDMKSACAFG